MSPLSGSCAVGPWINPGTGQRRNEHVYQSTRRWAATAEFKAAVADTRSMMMDRYIGKISSEMDGLAKELIDLAKNSQSDSVPASAPIRGAVADMLQVTGLAEVKAAIAETKARLDRIEMGDPHAK